MVHGLLKQPLVFVLEKPFDHIKKDLQSWLSNLHNKTSASTIFITPNQNYGSKLFSEIDWLQQENLTYFFDIDTPTDTPTSTTEF